MTRRLPTPLDADAVAALQSNFAETLDRSIDKLVGDDDPRLREALRTHMLSAARIGASVSPEALKELAGSAPEDVAKATGGLQRPLPLATRLTMQAAALLRSSDPRADEMFGDEDRLYFPLSQDGAASPTQKAVAQRLGALGYTVTDYAKNFATDGAGKQQFRIGKLLQKHAPDLLQDFMDDPSRTADRLLVCLSRDPQDVATMSTGRGWESCMTHGGINWRYVKHDVREGSLVGYLISENDPNIQNPLGRILLKPYRNADGAVVMSPADSFGFQNTAFERTMGDLGALFSSGDAVEPGRYRLANSLYVDGVGKDMLVVPETATAEQFLNEIGCKYTRDAAGRLEVQNLRLSGAGMRQLPDLSDVTVKGNLSFRQCSLESLKGLPQRIGGDIDLSDNRLESLDGLPAHVHGSLWLSGNPLKTLDGAPRSVGGSFYANDTILTTLRGGPQQVGGSYNVAKTPLQSLDGMPAHVPGDVELSGTELKSLRGGPASVGGSFLCNDSLLESLEGGPQTVGGGYGVMRNSLSSLKGVPQHVPGSFAASGNRLTSLKDGPQQVDGEYYLVSFNQLTDLHGAPQRVGTFNAFGNWLNTLDGAPQQVDGDFVCNGSRIASLAGAPRHVAGDFQVANNDLRSLEGGPDTVGGSFDCSGNRLGSLAGGPAAVAGDYVCSNNGLSDLEGMPGTVGQVQCTDNPLTSYRGAKSFTSLVSDRGTFTPVRIPARMRDPSVPAPTLAARASDLMAQATGLAQAGVKALRRPEQAGLRAQRP